MPTIQDIMAKKAEFQKELTEFGKAALSEEFKKVFDAHPEIKAIRWTQYTPYFNDGETCEFSRHDLEVRLADTAEDEFESSWNAKTPKLKKAFSAVRPLERIDEEIFEAVFGDHCQVTATREGFEVEECEHD